MQAERHKMILPGKGETYAFTQLFVMSRYWVVEADMEGVWPPEEHRELTKDHIPFLKRAMSVRKILMTLNLKQAEALNIDAWLRFYSDTLAMLDTGAPATAAAVRQMIQEDFPELMLEMNDQSVVRDIDERYRDDCFGPNGELLNVGRFILSIGNRAKHVASALHFGLNFTAGSQFEYAFGMTAGEALKVENLDLGIAFVRSVRALHSGMYEHLQPEDRPRLSSLNRIKRGLKL